MSHIINPMTLGIVSLRLYESMNRQAALDTPSRHKNMLMVDMNGRLDMRDLKVHRKKQILCKNANVYVTGMYRWYIQIYLKFRIEKKV